MKPIAPEDRRVANYLNDAFTPLTDDTGKPDGEALQVNNSEPGFGFHVYRMAPGQTTAAHEHIGDEEFILIEGDLVDHDGYRYNPGDIVWLRAGTKHNSHSENGCLLAVYLKGARPIE